MLRKQLVQLQLAPRTRRAPSASAKLEGHSGAGEVVPAHVGGLPQDLSRRRRSPFRPCPDARPSGGGGRARRRAGLSSAPSPSARASRRRGASRAAACRRCPARRSSGLLISCAAPESMRPSAASFSDSLRRSSRSISSRAFWHQSALMRQQRLHEVVVGDVQRLDFRARAGAVEPLRVVAAFRDGADERDEALQGAQHRARKDPSGEPGDRHGEPAARRTTQKRKPFESPRLCSGIQEVEIDPGPAPRPAPPSERRAVT